jgi:hypothetical protein
MSLNRIEINLSPDPHEIPRPDLYEMLKKEDAFIFLHSPSKQVLSAQMTEDGVIGLEVLNQEYPKTTFISRAAAIAASLKSKVRLTFLDGIELELDYNKDPELLSALMRSYQEGVEYLERKSAEIALLLSETEKKQ